MKGMLFGFLFFLTAVLCRGMPETGQEQCAVLKVEYSEMKLFFDFWTERKGVELTAVPKAFNWLVRRTLKKEMESEKALPSFFSVLIDGMEAIVFVEYGKLEEKECAELNSSLDAITGLDGTDTTFTAILSGEDIENREFIRIILHSRDSKSFIIIKGKFTIAI